MLKQWLLAIPLVLASTMAIPAQAASIRDEAGMFSPEAVNQATARLDRAERGSGMTITIETIDSLNDRPVDQVALDHARRSGTDGIFVLIAKRDHKIKALASREFQGAFTVPRLHRIQDAFIAQMKQGDPDAALLATSQTIESEVAQAKATHGGNLRNARSAPVPAMPGRRAGKPQSGLGSLLMIGLVIVGVLFFIRLLGNLFGANRGYGAPGMMGRPGYGPGYGGGGGGFLSSMFGGIGGALAGNWLYDQFSGRHHGGYTESSSYGDAGTTGDAGGSDWAGGEAGDWGGGDGGGGGDWGGGGGGDWGGGDGGGGGDW